MDNDTQPLQTADQVHERVAACWDDLPPGLRKVAEFVLSHPDETAVSTSTELGQLTQTSDATVVRTARALGYDGMRDLRRAALESLSHRRNPVSVLSQRLSRLDDGTDREHNELERVADDAIDLFRRLPERIEPQDWDQAIAKLHTARRLYTFGLGTGQIPADYLALMLNRVGYDVTGLRGSGFLLAEELHRFRADDAVVVFAPLRQFREIDVLTEHARSVGAHVVLVTEQVRLSLAANVDHVLLTPASSTSLSGEVIPNLAVAHSLALALASRESSTAVATTSGFNALRAAIAGDGLDAAPIVQRDLGANPDES